MIYSFDQGIVNAMQRAVVMKVLQHIAALHLPAPEIVMIVLLHYK
jgi:hypothetical protein